MRRTGIVRVKTAGEDGLHGSLLGKVADGAIEGTMTLADTNASVLRDVHVRNAHDGSCVDVEDYGHGPFGGNPGVRVNLRRFG